MNTRRSISRRQLLRTSAFSLFAAALWPGVLQAADQKADEFHFFVINDLHYVNEQCRPFFEGLVTQLKATAVKVDFCLIAGDLADNGKAAQFAPVRDLFKSLGMPLHVVCGNHDFATNTDREAFNDLFPDSLNYSFDHRGYQFLGLDTCQGLSSAATIQAATFTFLDDAVARLDRKRPSVILTHFPLGPKVPNRPPNAEQLLARFKEYNLRAVFGGHYHALTERHIDQITLTTNPCCSFARDNHDGSKKKGYLLCHAKDGTISREFVEFPPAPAA